MPSNGGPMLLTARARNAIPSSKFALPGERKYPIEDPAHARNALARASQQRNAGNLSEGAYNEIVSKAHRKLVGDALQRRR